MEDGSGQRLATERRAATLLALKLGATAFGGPAAHIAMLRQEAVERRRWLDEQEFLDLLGVTNLIPGPNSTEMVMHVGHRRGGRGGMVLAGAAFILPAALITLAFAWLYVRYGTTPAGEDLLYGIKPVIIAIVVQALWGLGRTALKDLPALLVGIAVLVLYLVGLNEIVLLFGGGLALVGLRRIAARPPPATAFALAPVGVLPLLAAAATAAAVAYSPARLFFTFLKIGSLLYGSGYVLLAFLRNDFVVRYGWLTDQQLLDAVAIGQVTPGPVFTTATFVGYLVGGWTGAILATIGIFLPAFVFVALTHPLIHRLRELPSARVLLDGLNVAAVGLMAAVSWTLGREAIVDVTTAILATVSAILLFRFRLNATWLILVGGCVGLVRWFVT